MIGMYNCGCINCGKPLEEFYVDSKWEKDENGVLWFQCPKCKGWTDYKGVK